MFIPEYGSSDPLENQDFHGRQQLCQDAIDAKQFAGRYNKAYYSARRAKVTLTEWDMEDNPLNYQLWDPEQSKYEQRHVRIGSNAYEMIKSLQCVNTTRIKWF